MKPGMRVYGTIVSRTLNNIVAYVNQIYDEDKKLFQSEINSGLQSSIDNIDSDISGIRSSISDIQTDVADIQTNVAGISTDVNDIKSDVQDLDEKITQEINDRLSGDTVLLDAINLLNANSSTQGSVQYWIKQAIDAVVADAPEAFDTLKEIADWIAQDQHGTAALINRVAANEEAVAAINRAITQLETTLSQTDQRLSDAISTANSEIDLLLTSLSEIDQRLTNAVLTANSEIEQLQSDVATDVQDLQTFKTTVAQNEQTLTTEINNAKQSINSTLADLNQFKTDIRTEVESDISTAVSDSIAREQEIWTDVARVDGRVTTVSNKVTDVDNTVKGITDANGNIKYTEALQSVIDTGISNNNAFNNISARWAVLDENQQVLEWMAAGFKSQASPSTSFASVYATGKQETSDAISALNTTIAGLGNTYVAKANLSTEVNTIVKEGLNVDSYSEVALQSDVDGAESRMSSKYDTLSGTVGTLSSNVASISTKANSNEAKISAITTTDGSGTLFLNESKVDSAMYNLLANTTSSAYSGVSGIADTKIAALDVTSKINGAISSLREEVSADYVAKANLSTEVESAIKTGLNIQSYSEIALDSDVSAAEARMTSQYSTLDTNVRGLSTTLAGVSTKADANEAKVNAITTTDSSSTTVLSQSALNSAMLLLLGQGGSQTKTTIQSLAYEEAGSYFATVDISTIVHNAVENEISQAGVASKSYVDEKVSTAETTIYGYLKDGQGNIISSSSIQNKANANEAKINAITTTDSSSTTVLSQSALNSAMILLLGGVGDNTKTRIESLAYSKAGDYFATIDMLAIVHNEIEDEIAQGGIASQSYVQGQVSSAETTIYSYLKDSNDNIISSASIQNTANANAAKLAALATWNGNTPTGYVYTSGLVTEANKDSAIASLFAQGTSSTSKNNVMAMITAEVQGEVSSLTLTADKIYLNANETLANTIRATQGTIGGFTIGSDSIFYGDYVSGSFGIYASETDGPVLSISRSAGLEEHHGVRLNESGLTFYSNYRRLHIYEETNKINLDGSGFLASGNFSWNTSGDVFLTNENGGSDEKLLLRSTGFYWDDSGDYTNVIFDTDGIQIASHGTGSVTANEFIRNGSSDSYVLLGGGGHSQLKTINGNSIFGTGDITISGGSSTIDWSNVQNKPNFATVATSGSYNDLSNKPTIPTVPTNVSAFTNDAGYLTQHQSLAGYLPLTGGTITGDINVNGADIVQTDGFIQNTSTFNGDVFYAVFGSQGEIKLSKKNGKFADVLFGAYRDGSVYIEDVVKAAGFQKRNGLSTLFLKADGSVDSNTYVTRSPSYLDFEQSSSYEEGYIYNDRVVGVGLIYTLDMILPAGRWTYAFNLIGEEGVWFGDGTTQINVRNRDTGDPIDKINDGYDAQGAYNNASRYWVSFYLPQMTKVRIELDDPSGATLYMYRPCLNMGYNRYNIQ